MNSQDCDWQQVMMLDWKIFVIVSYGGRGGGRVGENDGWGLVGIYRSLEG